MITRFVQVTMSTTIQFEVDGDDERTVTEKALTDARQQYPDYDNYEVESIEPAFKDSTILPPQSMDAYVDGGCLNNGGANPQAYGRYKLGNGVVEEVQFPRARTNNEAEYLALISLLNFITHACQRGVVVHLDSALVFNTVVGTWKIKQNRDRLIPLRNQAKELVKRTDARLEWTDNRIIKRILGI